MCDLYMSVHYRFKNPYAIAHILFLYLKNKIIILHIAYLSLGELYHSGKVMGKREKEKRIK